MRRMLISLVGLVSLAVATGHAEQTTVADPPKLPSHLAPKPKTPRPRPSRTEVQAEINRVANKIGVDPKKIVLSEEERTASVGDHGGIKPAGGYRYGNDYITVYRKNISNIANLKGVIAHEMMHFKQWHVEKYLNEHANEAGLNPVVSVMGVHFSSEATEARVRAREGTPYSLQYWDAAEKLPPSERPGAYRSAEYETLADMAQIKAATGKLPDASKEWLQLFHGIEWAYDRIQYWQRQHIRFPPSDEVLPSTPWPPNLLGTK
jgi:hypothetical protein